MLKLKLTCLLLMLGVAGCAAHPDPIVDTKGVNPQLLAADWEDCEAYTEQIEIGRGVARGLQGNPGEPLRARTGEGRW